MLLTDFRHTQVANSEHHSSHGPYLVQLLPGGCSPVPSWLWALLTTCFDWRTQTGSACADCAATAGTKRVASSSAGATTSVRRDMTESSSGCRCFFGHPEVCGRR